MKPKPTPTWRFDELPLFTQMLIWSKQNNVDFWDMLGELLGAKFNSKINEVN